MRLLSLAFAPAVLVASPLQAQDGVRVHVKSTLYRGERVHVSVSVRDGGYLIVLRADTYGRVHVLYPRSPAKDGWVRANGGRHAFVASESDGAGIVLAALADRPYSFNLYTKDGEWDRALLGQQRIGVGADAEEGLLDIVRQMAGSDDFDYDLAAYRVRARVSAPWYPIGTGYYDSWDGCYRPVFGSRWGWGFDHRWSYPFAPIGYDAFDYYFNAYSYRAWCGYPYGRGWGWGWGWRRPVIVVSEPPSQPPGRYTFKDRPVTRRPGIVEPRRRDPMLVSSPFRMTPKSGDVVRRERGRVSNEKVRTQSFTTRGRGSGGGGSGGWGGSGGGSVSRGGSSSGGGAGTPKSSAGTMAGGTRETTTRRP